MAPLWTISEAYIRANVNRVPAPRHPKPTARRWRARFGRFVLVLRITHVRSA